MLLGIESSCDETGLALYHPTRGLVAEALHSQIATHACYGGVVPELASRDHVTYLVPLLQQVLAQANITPGELTAIAYTAWPGLVGALLTGAAFAKSLAYALHIPSIAINHLEAHWLIAMMEHSDVSFPYVVLLVSGGHTQLIEVGGLNDYQILGETLDDAAGEAFDKTAKMMGLPYPGGAELSALAAQYDEHDEKLADFPCPMIDKPNCDMSFSGLKTHALLTWRATSQDDSAKRSVAYAFQTAVVKTLTAKCERAIRATGLKTLIVAGGVSANTALRTSLAAMMIKQGGRLIVPSPKYCTDNGVMVAYAGALYDQQGHADETLAIEVKARV